MRLFLCLCLSLLLWCPSFPAVALTVGDHRSPNNCVISEGEHGIWFGSSVNFNSGIYNTGHWGTVYHLNGLLNYSDPPSIVSRVSQLRQHMISNNASSASLACFDLYSASFLSYFSPTTSDDPIFMTIQQATEWRSVRDTMIGFIGWSMERGLYLYGVGFLVAFLGRFLGR